MKKFIQALSNNKLLALQSILFFCLSLSLIVTNGLINCWWGGCGLHVGQWHMHDAFWHISMSKIAFDSWPFAHPFYAGENVFGYNYFIDLIIFGFSKIGFNPMFTFFQLLPVLITIFYITVCIKFAYTFLKTKTQINSLIFFLFFGSSLSYIATLYAGGTFYYSSMRGFPVITSIQPGMMFLNLQFALSLPLILLTLIHFKSSLKLTSAFWYIPLLFVISGLKFYGGIVISLILGGMILIRLLKKDHVALRFFQLGAILLGNILAQYLFYSKSGVDGIPFAFWPFALPHVLIDDPLLFNNHNWTLARYFLYENGGWRSPRLIALESFTVFLLAIMNFGTRLIGVLAVVIKKIRLQLNLDDLVIFLVILFTFFMPTFFVQDGGWFNTMQFLYYGIFFGSIYSGIVMGYFASINKLWSKILVIGIIILTIPNLFEQLRYLTEPQNLIPQSELLALKKLENSPKGTVFISKPELKNAIVPALSGQTAYYLDIDQLMVTHIDYEARRQEILNVKPENILNLPVDYFYIYKNDEGGMPLIEKLLQSDEVKLLAETESLAIFQR